MNEITQEMIDFFEVRTKEHIDRVKKSLEKVAVSSQYSQDLIARSKIHDASKYEKEERVPYIWLTEFHRCRNNGIDFEYPDGMKSKTEEASDHHVHTNSHHPEAHNSPNDMSDADIIEMVCDWTAMAEELGDPGGSARSWADKNIGSKWKFNEEKKNLIYDTIDVLEYWSDGEPWDEED